jgi:hypothetical protein
MRLSNNVFPQLARGISDRCNVPIVQFWTAQGDNHGQMSPELEGIFCRDKTFPLNFLTNPQIAVVVERIAQEQAPLSIRAVEMIFPQPVAIFLKRYALDYCIYIFLGNIVLPSANMRVASNELAALTTVVMLLFLKDPPAQDLLSILRSTVQSALSSAVNNGSLLLTPTKSMAQATRLQPQPSLASLFPVLVPHRIEDVASSPFAFSGAGLDASMRRFYAAINGQKNVHELTVATRCTMEQAYATLQVLVAQQLIELYTPEGQPVDSSQLFKRQ